MHQPAHNISIYFYPAVSASICLCCLKVFGLEHEDCKAQLCLTFYIFIVTILQPSVRTRRSNGSADDTTFNGALKCFSNISSTRSIIRRIGLVEIQLLLVHGFEVIL